jgi:hypothetical protein
MSVTKCMSANPIKIVTLIIGQMSKCQMTMGQLECYNQKQKETVASKCQLHNVCLLTSSKLAPR